MTLQNDDNKVKPLSNESIIWRNSREVSLGSVSIYYSCVGEMKSASRGQMNINITISPFLLTFVSKGILPLDHSQTYINILTRIMHWSPAGIRFLSSFSWQGVKDWSHPLSNPRETALALRCFNQFALKTSCNESMRLMRICWKIKWVLKKPLHSTKSILN